MVGRPSRWAVDHHRSGAEKLDHPYLVGKGKVCSVTWETGSDPQPRKAGWGADGRQGTRAAGRAGHGTAPGRSVAWTDAGLRVVRALGMRALAGIRHGAGNAFSAVPLGRWVSD